MSESENWTPPPPGTHSTDGVARLADGSVVFVRDPFRLRPQRQPKSPRPAAKDYPGRAGE